MKRPHTKDSNSHHAVKTLKTEASQQRPSLRVPLISDFQATLSASLKPVAPRAPQQRPSLQVPLISDFQATLSAPLRPVAPRAPQQRPSLRVPRLSDFKTTPSAPLRPVAPRAAKPATELVQHHSLARSVTPTLTKIPCEKGSGYSAYLEPSRK